MQQKITTLLALLVGLLLVTVLLRTFSSGSQQTQAVASAPHPSARAPDPSASPAYESLQVDIFAKFTYVAEGFPMGLATGHTYLDGLRSSAPEALSKEPAYKSGQIGYSFIKFGNAPDNTYTFVSDGEKLFFDTDNDEDLSEETGSDAYRSLIAFEYELIDAQGQSSKKPYQIWYFFNNGPRFYAQCHYAGRISFGGYYTYQAVAFEDGNPDGLFRNDGLWIDFNGDGKLEDKEHYADGAVLEVGGKKFTLRLNYP
ncbi:MAG: hypothetical protein ACAI44_16690 [Candidatus Sericytochromatia bacterium]